MQSAKINLNYHDECKNYIASWQQWFRKQPAELALIEVPIEPKDYNDIVGRKTRYMVRKAARLGYKTGRFHYNENLKEMYEINTSTTRRQDRPMTRAYFEQLTPINEDKKCEIHKQIYYGVFDSDFHLRGYSWIAIVGNIGILNRIIGHADYLKDGMMNLLIADLVMYFQGTPVQYINYLTMRSASESLTGFKKRTGFESMKVEVVS